MPWCHIGRFTLLRCFAARCNLIQPIDFCQCCAKGRRSQMKETAGDIDGRWLFGYLALCQTKFGRTVCRPSIVSNVCHWPMTYEQRLMTVVMPTGRGPEPVWWRWWGAHRWCRWGGGCGRANTTTQSKSCIIMSSTNLKRVVRTSRSRTKETSSTCIVTFFVMKLRLLCHDRDRHTLCWRSIRRWLDMRVQFYEPHQTRTIELRLICLHI